MKLHEPSGLKSPTHWGDLSRFDARDTAHWSFREELRTKAGARKRGKTERKVQELAGLL